MIYKFGNTLFTTKIGSTGNTYYLLYNIDNNECKCSCKDALFRNKKCKHIIEFEKEVEENMAKSLNQVKNVETTTRKFPSSLKCIHDLFGEEPYNSGELFGIYAMANTGKSLICFQEAIFLLSMGYKVFYIDTEGSAEKMMNKWLETFECRFKNIDYNNMLLEDRYRNLPNLMAYLGYHYRAVVKKSDSKTGKFESNFYPMIENNNKNPLVDIVEPRLVDNISDLKSDIDKLDKKIKSLKTDTKKEELTVELQNMKNKLKDKEQEYSNKKSEYRYFVEELEDFNPDFIIIDSITNPIRAFIPNSMQNYPEKSFVEGVILSKFLDMQNKHSCGVICTFHGTTNVGNSYDTEIKIRGGMAIKHNIKRMIMIEQRKKKEVMAYRKLWLYRSEDEQEFGAVNFCKICDDGYIDVDDTWENIAKILMTDGDMKRLQRDTNE